MLSNHYKAHIVTVSVTFKNNNNVFRFVPEIVRSYNYFYTHDMAPPFITFLFLFIIRYSSTLLSGLISSYHSI